MKSILEHKFNISRSIIDYSLNGEEALEVIIQDLEAQNQTIMKKPKTTFDPQLVPSSYTLILMDCNMPFMDGYECSKLIRKTFFEKMGVGVI